MNKLIVTLMCGLARSGKSTWIGKHSKNNVVICPDRIRKLIFGHQFHKNAEDFIWAYARGMARLLLEQNKNIIIDATNLNYGARSQWYNIAEEYKAKIIVVWVKTSLRKCLVRNNKSPEDEKLPSDVLKKMEMIFEDPYRDPCERDLFDMKVIEYRG